MHKIAAKLAIPHRAHLGEGALWDEKRGVLWYVDITQGILHEHSPGGKATAHPMDKMIGTVGFIGNRELIVALEDGLYIYHPTMRRIRFLTQPIPRDLAGDMRFNDGKVDPQGRFWVGSLCKKNKPVLGTLYRMEDSYSVQPVLHGITCSNGMGWSPQGDVMYFIDTATRQVSAFDYNPTTADLQNRRPVVTLAEGEGGPDGMTVDAQGMLWVAHWGGWQVSRYDPATGEKLMQVDVPAEQVTSCVFGGPEMKTLYITTAGGAKEDPHQPNAGAVFACEPGVAGLPAYRMH